MQYENMLLTISPVLLRGWGDNNRAVLPFTSARRAFSCARLSFWRLEICFSKCATLPFKLLLISCQKKTHITSRDTGEYNMKTRRFLQDLIKSGRQII